MRKWLFLLAIFAVIYFILKANKNKKDKSPFFKRLDEAITIIVWVLLSVYTLSFLYWLFKQLLNK
ncbi:MAG: hypothetical protein ACOC6P_03185 [Candidatus Aminicenantaceae bacterium]